MYYSQGELRQGDTMEKIFEQAMLYDFYGELLKDNQKEVFENYVLDNLSLSEIAEERNISRQAVYDMIKRADRALNEYEDKLHLLEKFLTIKEDVNRIHIISKQLTDSRDRELATQIVSITDKILDEL